MSEVQIDSALKEKIQQLEADITRANSNEALNVLKQSWFGKNGILKQLYGGLKNLSADQRGSRGKWIKQCNQSIDQAIAKQSHKLAENQDDELSHLDLTLPARDAAIGTKHPNTLVIELIVNWFTARGFDINSGKEIESDWYNFEALNIPKSHPARTMHDTFYLKSGKLLRTHTSTAQIRTLEDQQPPIYVISPGRVYRRDSDITHTPVFHQIEGMVVDKHISFGDLKLLLTELLQFLFGSSIKTRFRPSFFPFTEPSAEVDVSCFKCAGKGCRVCSQSGWLEILGSGLISPQRANHQWIRFETMAGVSFWSWCRARGNVALWY